MATIPQALAAAIEHHRAGRLATAEEIYRRILAVAPDEANSLNLLGVIAHSSGRHEMALDYIQRAVRLQDGEAIFHNNLGNVWKDMGKADEAVACYRRAVELDPRFVKGHNNLAVILRELGKLDEAVSCCRRVVELLPDDAEAQNHLGNLLIARGRLDEAAACYRRAIDLSPGYFQAYHNLGNVFREQGSPSEAVACYHRALQLKPDAVDTHCNLGTALKDLGRLDEAVACYRRALQIRPDDVRAHGCLGNALLNQGNLDEAGGCYERALQLQPDYAEGYYNLSILRKDQGRLEEALVCCDKALALRPGMPEAHANRLYMLYFRPDYDAAAIRDEHRRWNCQFALPLAGEIRAHVNDRSPGRRLRLGYVSPDLRCHPVGRFLLPILEAHDRQRFEVLAYASVRRPDAVTQQCREQVDAWRNAIALSDEQLAAAIRADQVDILVDLTMQMGDNRLPAFARKPAPVQVTYLAYPGTTGLDTVDYRLTDPYLDPPGDDATVYSERSIHLPETFWCYRPAIDTPPPGPLPALLAGHVTFGCLNNFCKVSAPAMAAWSRILLAVPQSHLLLHAHGGGHRACVWEFFQRQGVAAERVEFLDFLPIREYYGAHERIDIALDPFPYGGGTTTCDALWMGVPVVSLVGRTAVGRGGLSILSNIGLADLASRDIEGYVALAAALAGDTARLTELRASLRGRMQASPLMDAVRFTRNLEAAYREMWRRWCANR